MLLLGLWLWGRGAADGSAGGAGAPATGDIAAVGRPPGVPLPPAHRPLGPSRPTRVDVPSLGIEAPVAGRGLDATGAVDPPPYTSPGTVGWYDAGTQPGAAGTAILVGHVDTDTRPAVFYPLSAAKAGGKVRVTRADGSAAEFTIDDVAVVPRKHFDAAKVYGAARGTRAELRLITCGGTFDPRTHEYTANVVVSAYLTGVTEATDKRDATGVAAGTSRHTGTAGTGGTGVTDAASGSRHAEGPAAAAAARG
ncbi:class F sortase [Streptomyces fuscigenes]|uniref:class F sortase n=1 Tax=Streptomyces fuscigenes TaxID=1528880 RepID=UPI001F1864A8|nr:class F sortase [Streptomyces fuscigenes]MCF3961446.1 class F sortase [Streptomyces fuscigenes]